MSSPNLGPKSVDFLGAFLVLFEGALTVCNVVDVDDGSGGRDLDPVISIEALDGRLDFDFIIGVGLSEDDGGSFKLLCLASFAISSFSFVLDSLLNDIFDFSDVVGVFVPDLSKNDSLFASDEFEVLLESSRDKKLGDSDEEAVLRSLSLSRTDKKRTDAKTVMSIFFNLLSALYDRINSKTFGLTANTFTSPVIHGCSSISLAVIRFAGSNLSICSHKLIALY